MVSIVVVMVTSVKMLEINVFSYQTRREHGLEPYSKVITNNVMVPELIFIMVVIIWNKKQP